LYFPVQDTRHEFLVMSEKKNNVTKPPEISTAQKKIQKAAAIVTDQHVRLNFLHQSAIFVSEQSSAEEDAFTKLSRKYVREIRECLNSDRVKVEPNFMRTFCKKCKQVFVNGKVRRFDLQMVQRKVMQRKCRRCGNSSNFQVGSVLTRNEKAKEAEKQLTEAPHSAEHNTE
ncbi:hypothetical protein PFISCL1PPCAC_16683, partial [Pristionchus fissidentatus]